MTQLIGGHAYDDADEHGGKQRRQQARAEEPHVYTNELECWVMAEG
jgi:hypothetical protein